MILASIPCSIIITEVENHSQIKQTILDQIADGGVYGMQNKHQKIYNTDVHMGSNFPKPYLVTAREGITKHNIEVARLLNCPEHCTIATTNAWYQQYQTGDWHDWHSHPGCNLSNVYYVQLEEANPKTTFKYMGKVYQIDIKEGMIITFPSYLLHYSPVNQSNSTKTVIAYNSQIEPA